MVLLQKPLRSWRHHHVSTTVTGENTDAPRKTILPFAVSVDDYVTRAAVQKIASEMLRYNWCSFAIRTRSGSLCSQSLTNKRYDARVSTRHRQCHSCSLTSLSSAIDHRASGWVISSVKLDPWLGATVATTNFFPPACEGNTHFQRCLHAHDKAARKSFASNAWSSCP